MTDLVAQMFSLRGLCFFDLRMALLLVRRVRRRGLLFLAPVCSTFTFINMPSTGRCFLLPHGLPLERVSDANKLVARTTLLYNLGETFRLVVTVEQPVHRSVGGGMIRLQAWQRLIEQIATYRATVAQGQYGANTVKPTWLFSNHTLYGTLCSWPDSEQMARIHNLAGSDQLVRKRKRVTRLFQSSGPAFLGWCKCMVYFVRANLATH